METCSKHLFHLLIYFHPHFLCVLRGVDELQRTWSLHLQNLTEEIFFVAFDSKDRVEE